MAKRTPKEKIIDRFLLLYVLAKSSKRVERLGRTKLQKIVFLSEWKMISHQMKGLNYNYIKLLHGPYSQELEDDTKRLVKMGDAYAGTLLPTEKGLCVIEDFGELIARNKSFLDVIDGYVRQCTSVDLQTLLDRIYALKHPMRRNITIDQTPLRTPILYPLSESNAETTFNIGSDDLENLEMSLDPGVVEGLIEGMEDVKAGRLLNHKEVFS